MRIAPFAGLCLVTAALAMPTCSAFAANGYFPHAVGMKAAAVGGAGVAFPQDALSGANNPAAPGFLGNRFDAGLGWLSPDRAGEISGNSGGETVNGVFDGNDRSGFILPEIGYNNQYREHLAVGFALYSSQCMNTSYTTPVPLLGTSKAGLDLMQAFLVPYAAYTIGGKHSIGAGINVGWQALEVSGLENLAAASADTLSVTNLGHESSMGLGFTAGYMGRVHPKVDVGAVYQSRVYMGRFKKYQGLFAEMGDFDNPPSLAAGIAVRAHPRATVAFDIRRIWYSTVKSAGNPLQPNFSEALLGDDDGAGPGWEDVTAIKFGLRFEATDKVALMGGYNYGGQPVPRSETMLNMLTGAVAEHHITLGATVVAWGRAEVTLAYMHALESEVKGSGSIPESGDVPEGYVSGGGEADLKASANFLGLAVGWTF